MKILLLDVDNTMATFQPTKILYFRLFLNEKNRNKLKYQITARIMIFLLKFCWFIPGIIEFQRKWIMTLFSKVPNNTIDKETDLIVDMVMESYRNTIGKRIDKLRNPNDKVYILSHCPKTIAQKLSQKLGFDGDHSIEITDYFSQKNLNIINKHKIVKKLKEQNIGSEIIYFADDLIDFKCLKSADQGILVNGSNFTKGFCKLFAKKITIWE
ncbi:hypothetical protein ACFLZV_00960 [Candidatus Margulisiibacteriota bacterium]